MWNDIELLTSDDTGSGYLSVGSRSENGTALYQVNLLAKISSEKISLNPKIQACSLSDGFIIVADQSVILLDSVHRSLQLHLIFDTEVDVVGLCQGGAFLLVGERSGNVHLIHVTSEQTLLTNAFVEKANDEHRRTYQNLVIEKDGSNEAIENADLDTAKKLQGQIKSSFISTENYHALGCLNLVTGDLASETPVIIGGIGNCAFSKWEPDSSKKGMTVKNHIDAEIIKGAKKFQLIDNLLFILDTENVLSLWDVYTLTPIWNWPSLHIEEFLLTTEADSPSSVTWLSRLLHKHRFAEAESFAIQFGLDVELVYKVKSNDILETLALSPEDTSEQTKWQQLVDEAKETLHKIQDDEFVVNYCLKAQWITYETTQEMLNYAKARLLKKEDKLVPAYSDDLVEVLRAQAKLTTFYGAFGPEKFSGSAWIEFLNNKDDLKDIFLQLREGNLVCAQYLWLRHRANFQSRFDVKMLENLLNSISTPVSLQKLCPWLKNDVIPFVRRTVPEGQKDYQNTEEVGQLRTLVNNLQELITLHRKYNCRLSLSDFEKENATTIVFRMFDRVLAPELIPLVLEKSIRLYMREHDLQEEELLLLYIEDLLNRCSSKSTSLFDTAWEAKAMAVIGCLSDTDLIFDAVLKIMYVAVVPWSAAVEQLVKQHLEMDHPKVKLLQESYKLMEMKKLLRGYGIREVNLLNKEIMTVVRYILKQDVPSSLEDALKVAQGYRFSDDEIYSLRIIDLIDREQGEDCLLLLRSLPPVQAEKTAERVIIWARLALQEEPDDSKEDKAWRMSVAKTSVDILKLLCDIQKDYSDSALVANLRERCIKAHEVAQARQKPRSTPEPIAAEGTGLSTKSKLQGQALALQVPPQELEAELAFRALKDGNVRTALSKCRDLFKYHCSADTGRLLFLMCQKLCLMLANEVPMRAPEGLNLPSEVHNLACQAVTICSPDFLLDALELCKYTLTAVELSRQCHMDDCGILMQASFGTHKDPYEEWSYSDFFSEDGIVLESQMVLPVIYELISTLVPLAGDNLILPVIHSISTLLQNLQESSQWELALRFVVGSFGTCLQHSVSNFMNASLSEKLLGETTLVNSRHVVMELKEKSVTFIRGNATTLLHKVFNCRLVDLDLALGYCTLLPQKDVFENLWKLVDKAWQNYDKILAISLVGSQLASLYQEIDIGLQFRELSTDAQWGIRLGKLGISFQPVFRQHILTKKDLIKALVKNVDMDISLILEYCRTFQLDCDAALQLFIETLLHNTNVSQSQGDTNLASTKQQHSKLLAKAIEMVPLLTSTKDLVISLSGILRKLDPYDYEMIEVVLKVIERADEKITNININQFSLDTLYVSTAKHVFENNLKPKLLKLIPAKSSALMNREIAKITQTIESYLLSIVNPEWAVAIAITLTQDIPEGSFKMSSLKFCLYLAERWLENIPLQDETREKAQALLKKLHLQFRRSGTEAVLIAHKLNTGEYLRMIGKPAHLIVSLYEHPSISQRMQNSSGKDYPGENKTIFGSRKKYCFDSQLSDIENSTYSSFNFFILNILDIHAAAKEIAEVNEINLEKIWDMLLEKWLCPSTAPDVEPLELFELQEDEALQSPVLVLQTLGMRQLTFAHKTRALQCLLYLADKETIESLFKKPIEEVKSYLKCVTFLAVFETLNIPITYELFCNSPKEGMVKGLWKNHSHEPMAVRLITELCLEYNIYDLKLWNGLLQKLLGFNMNFLGSCNPQIILKQLEEHMSEGQLAGFSHQIRNLILNNVINKKEFGILAKTKYFQMLKLHMINANNITELVHYLANELR
ncbi:Kinetochore-associated protein 1 [Sciurus carolinensis]|uniref:Kinetochore-associated protein 1 n=1 Tax=Sciurus carolinensis TaxID=30640 RepID=A0AA41NKH3_SCICA|nr:Kinetochore-associated protein 1 [Sciurus carolinensis]